MINCSRIAFLVSLIALTIACNESDQDSPPDAGPDARHQHDPDAQNFPDADADTDDSLERWPGQEIDEDPLGLDWDMPEADDGLLFLFANVGNIDIYRCQNVGFNLCWTEQEAIIAEEIANRDADVILLQEVLVPEQCDDLDPPPAEDHVCHPDFQPPEIEQVRRLVGPDYTIACDAARGYECVAVRVGKASIVGCDDGELCRGLARTNEPVEGCDTGFTISAVTIDVDDQLLDVVNVHPPSDAAGASHGRQCRRDYFDSIFGEDAPLIEQEKVVIGGDFNFDPFRQSSTYPDVEFWNQYVSTSYDQTHDAPLLFAYHSGLPEHDPPYWTTPILSTTLDHVISNSLRGHCITLGAHPGEAPLDHARGRLAVRLDHLAMECLLSW